MKYPQLFRYYDDFEITLSGEDKDLLARENMTAFSIDEIAQLTRDAAALNPVLDDINDFYISKLVASERISVQIHVYVWLDEMAGQLRASLFMGDDTTKLPFRSEFLTTRDRQAFVDNYSRLLKGEIAEVEPLLILLKKI